MNSKLAQGLVYSMVAAAAVMGAGCGPEGTMEAEPEAQASLAPEAQEEREVTASCVPTWDAYPIPNSLAVFSPWSSTYPGEVQAYVCLKQASSCGSQSRTYSAKCEAVDANNGTTIHAGATVSNISFTAGSGQQVCNYVRFSGCSRTSFPFRVRITADATNVVAEVDESNNVYLRSFVSDF